MAAVQIYYRNCGAQASWWRRGLLHPGGAGSLEKKPWVWTTVVGEEGVLNSGPASPPIELAEVGRELAVACGKQSLLKEVGEVLALVFGVPSTPQDVRQEIRPSLVLVKEERLFRKGMGQDRVPRQNKPRANWIIFTSTFGGPIFSSSVCTLRKTRSNLDEKAAKGGVGK